MKPIVIERRIAAAPERVFRAVADVEHLSEVVPDVARVEFLTEQKIGAGTRFVETRLMRGKEMPTELDVTEHAENEHVRMVAHSHGTIWDTTFDVRPDGDGTTLRLQMDARGKNLPARVMNKLMRGLYAKGIEKHVDAVQAWCER